METINDRITWLINRLESGKKADFAKKIGIKPPSLQNYTNEKKSVPSSTVLTGILKAYQQINAQWLLLGEGEPFLKRNLDCEKQYEVLSMQYAELNRQYQAQSKKIQRLVETVSTLQRIINKESLVDLSDSEPDYLGKNEAITMRTKKGTKKRLVIAAREVNLFSPAFTQR